MQRWVGAFSPMGRGRRCEQFSGVTESTSALCKRIGQNAHSHLHTSLYIMVPMLWFAAVMLRVMGACGQNPAPHLVRERSKVYCHPPGCGYNTARDDHYRIGDARLPRAWAAGWRRAAAYLALDETNGGTATFSLRFLSGVFRHGDRSGMTDIPHTDKPRWDCSVPVDDEAAIAVFSAYRAQYEAYECIIDPPLDREQNIAAWSGSAEAEIDPENGDSVPFSDTTAGCGPQAVGRTYPPGPGTNGLRLDKHSPGTACEGGQLTYTGMQQHMRLGTVFRQLLTNQSTRYRVSPETTTRVRIEGHPLIPAAKDNDPRLVRFTSTNYGRTVLSAASFWSGFAPLAGARGERIMPRLDLAVTLAAVKASFALWTAIENGGDSNTDGHDETSASLPSVDEAAPMPNSGFAASRVVKVVPREVDPLLAAKDHPRCPLAVRIKEELRSRVGRFRKLSGTASAAVKRLASLGGAHATVAQDAGSMRTLSAADLINTRLCSGQTLPCALDSAGRPMAEVQRRLQPDDLEKGHCLSSAAAALILRDADRDYGQRLAGPDVHLLMYPSLKGIAAQLRAVHERRTSLRFSARFAHDTVVYPLLAALGAGDSEWPGYASRITFELWALRAEPHNQTLGLVRVLYQGEDITPEMRCSSSWGPPHKTISGIPTGAGAQMRARAWLALAGSACTVDSFEAQIDELIAPYASYAEACALGPAGPAAAAAANATTDTDGGNSHRAGPF